MKRPVTGPRADRCGLCGHMRRYHGVILTLARKGYHKPKCSMCSGNQDSARPHFHEFVGVCPVGHLLDSNGVCVPCRTFERMVKP